MAATPYEANALTHTRLSTGQLYLLADNVWLIVAGVGRQAATQAIQRLLEQGVTHLMSWGVAGGLQPGLTSASILLPTTIKADKQQFFVDADWHNALLQQLTGLFKVHQGSIANSDKVLSDISDKQGLYAASQALAVDMESAAIARAADQQGLPFVVLRVVADPAELGLPSALLQSLNRNGQVNIARLLLNLLLRPWQCLIFMRIARSSYQALLILKLLAKQLQPHFGLQTTATVERELS